MSDLSQVYDALRQADAAGDTESASKLADYIRQQTDGTAQRQAALPRSMANIQQDQASYSPTSGMSSMDRAWAGAGKAAYDIGRGVNQLVDARRFVPDIAGGQQRVAAQRVQDAPLMDTTAGKVGNFAGNVAAIAPTTFIPGANSVPGAALIGTISGLLQPSASTKESIVNPVAGAVLAAGGQKVGQVVGDKLGNVMANRVTAAAERRAANSVRDQTLAEGRKLGYVAPASSINQESLTAQAADSLAGRAATDQTAAYRNQQVTNRLIKQDLGLSKNTPVTPDVLRKIRTGVEGGQVYAAVKKSADIMTDPQYFQGINDLAKAADVISKDFPDLNFSGSAEIQALQKGLDRQGFTAEGAMEAVKKLRADASKNLAWNVEDPSKKALGLAQREAATVVEDQIMRNLRANGQGALADSFSKARRLIAKTHDAEDALNPGTGNFIASKFKKMLSNREPLGGNMEKVAAFASSVHPSVVREELRGPGVSKLSAIVAGGSGLAGLATGNPLYALPALAPIAGEVARAGVLSRTGQALATPRYAANNSLLALMQQVAPLSAPVAVGFGNSKQ